MCVSQFPFLPFSGYFKILILLKTFILPGRNKWKINESSQAWTPITSHPSIKIFLCLYLSSPPKSWSLNSFLSLPVPFSVLFLLSLLVSLTLPQQLSSLCLQDPCWFHSLSTCTCTFVLSLCTCKWILFILKSFNLILTPFKTNMLLKQSGSNFLIFIFSQDSFLIPFLTGPPHNCRCFSPTNSTLVTPHFVFSEPFPCFKLLYPTACWTSSLDHSAVTSNSTCPSQLIICLTFPCVPCFMHTWYLIYLFIQQIFIDRILCIRHCSRHWE